jgi:CrcB protein
MTADSPKRSHDLTVGQVEVDPDLLARSGGATSERRRRQVFVLLAIAAGGALGTPARYAISRIVHVAPNSFPWSTFIVNVSGCFVLGVLLTLIIERWPPTRYARPFAAIGFLGAYTTFSTYMVETDLLVKNGAVGVAALYVVGSLVAGFVAVYLGIVCRRLWPIERGV